jgi:L-fucose mutarotase
MLKGIDPIISPPLIQALMEMGHGDEIVFADANFPAVSHTSGRIIFYSGCSLLSLLPGVLRLFPLDYAVDFSGILMLPPPAYPEKPLIWQELKTLLEGEKNGDKPFLFLPKPDFYTRSKGAFAIVSTGEKRRFSNVILRKGIIEA